MPKSRVALIGCSSYDDERVYEAVRAGINLLGGITQFVKPGENIVIKPNVLIGTNPRKCVCTHPSVLKAAAKTLLEANVNVHYGDSPGFGKSAANMKRAGLKHVADELGIKLADFDKGKSINHKEALLNKRFVIANGVLESDGLVSLPKLKAHGLTRLTGAVKNQFGCIPGFFKGQHHVKMSDPYDFATMLVDLSTFLRPRLYIMDGITAMEGNGPRSGTPKKLGVILISADPVALDSVACKIINLDPTFVPTSVPGERAGLGTYHYENIEVIGEKIENFLDPSFEVVRKPPASTQSGRVRALIRNKTCPRPVIDKVMCTNCGTCVQLCPVTPKAVNWHKGAESRPPSFEYNHCIRCYCCQELCPEGAVLVREPLLGRILFH
jgi:uncharacterized protein (DUF362 family)